MKIRLSLLCAMLAGPGSTLGAHIAHAQTCQELWIERNAYYNAVGYCFKTVRAIEYFGKKNCRVRSEEEAQRAFPGFAVARVQWIAQRERQIGCSNDTSRGPRLADATCSQLWVERNAYYKWGRYCFVTARARSYFGVEGCNENLDEDSVGSSFLEPVRARIGDIVELERSYSCRSE